LELELTGRTALITGASQGIGEGIAEVLAEEGCALRLIARSAENLDRISRALRERFGTDVQFLPIDLTEDGAAERVAEWAGDIDILVNNAGDTTYGDLWTVDDKTWKASFQLKFFSAVDLSRLFYPGMKARGAGVILNNIGILGETVDFNFMIGTSVCSAMESFTRSLGGGSLNDGIRVIGVSPGAVATPLLMRTIGEEGQKRFPGKRAATVREIAELFAFLASPRSAYTSGTVITIDGGLASRGIMS
jgi:NAD(P)-dependent dehydrogenase (short-subunit alcohol dehydrogenase family)